MIDWSRIPAELRERPQWCLAGPDKRPLTADWRAASVTDPTTWTDFDTVSRAAAARGCGIGYVQTADDPFACIDLDVKDATPQVALDRYRSIIDQFDSYTEHSQSGRGFHVWVRGKIGKGKRRDGVEVYSQARFMICTGNVVRDQPIAERQALLTNMVARMNPEAPADIELAGDDTPDWSAATRAAEDSGELGKLFRGDWQGRYESQSEADLALAKLLLPITESHMECWQTFRLSGLGKREKAKRWYYARRTMALAVQHHANDAAAVEHGQSMADGLFWQASAANENDAPSLLERMSIDWENDRDVDVPDIVEGLVADEEVTLLGGHGGVGKGFLALQMACAVALGEPVLGCATRQSRVLYYSAEDGRKRLTRRLRRMAETFDYDAETLRQNLRVLDASEVEPLYGEKLEPSVDNKRFMKVMGPSADFENLRRMVEEFDPQLVIIDGASDTFDGNEIVRREVRAFIKMLRRVHPNRSVGVLLPVHIDRASARGIASNDEGYAGSAQWHNSCRRRMFLQHQIKKDEDGAVLSEGFVLRVMKNQDGENMPEMDVQRGEFGLWQLGVEIGGDLAAGNVEDQAATVLRLIRDYCAKGKSISTSLSHNAPSGVYATLNGDPAFPQGLNRKRTNAIVRDLERSGALVAEQYKRSNRSWADRWTIGRDPNQPFEQGAPAAHGGTR